MTTLTSHDTGPLGRYPVFAITVGAIFAIVYVIVLAKDWPLFTYYPAVNEFALFKHPPLAASPGPPMKWFGYVGMSALLSLVAGIIAMLIPENLIRRLWQPGLVWIVSTISIVVVMYLIATE